MAAKRSDVSALLDKVIAILEGNKRSLEASLEALQTLKTHAQSLPVEMMDAILDSLKSIVGTRRLGRVTQPGTEEEAQAARAGSVSDPVKPHFQRIAEFFVNRDNHPAHNQMIQKATGLSRGAVAIVLYKSRADRFERVDLPSKPKKVWWKLKDDAFERIKKEDEIPF